MGAALWPGFGAGGALLEAGVEPATGGAAKITRHGTGLWRESSTSSRSCQAEDLHWRSLAQGKHGRRRIGDGPSPGQGLRSCQLGRRGVLANLADHGSTCRLALCIPALALRVSRLPCLLARPVAAESLT